ncbi:MAG: DUF4190 domain-containing protein [Planctomycetes bacterium]|nr:DUF4190 domain-containing protein [Planctomycetota bacterium]
MSESNPRDDVFEEGRPRPRPSRPQPGRDEGPPPLPDDYEQRARRRSRRRRERDYEDDDALSTIIPYHNGRALAAYYAGVFSFICFIGIPLGFAAIILGILGLKYVKKNPEAKGTGHAIAGIVLGSVTLVLHFVVILVIVVMGLKAQ